MMSTSLRPRCVEPPGIDNFVDGDHGQVESPNLDWASILLANSNPKSSEILLKHYMVEQCPGLGRFCLDQKRLAMGLHVCSFRSRCRSVGFQRIEVENRMNDCPAMSL